MAETEASLLRQFPLLLPQNRAKTVYEGFISAQGRDFHLRILLPKDLQLRNARLLCSWQLKAILNGYHHVVQQEVALKNKKELYVLPPPPQFYSSLIEEIGTLGWDKLVYVDACFSTIKLKAEDASGREHLITVKLKAKYPAESPDCIVDFPVSFSVSWTPQSSLISIHSQFLAALESLKAFWDVMDEIDEKTWVLEPEKPTRSATARRIALGNNASINIEVDPRHPTMLPECCFLGADHVVKPLGIRLSRNIHLWDPENSLLQNLKDVLEIDFPARAILEKSDFSMDCGICYAYQLDGAIPDQVCDNSRCGQPFHQICLYEWLRGLLTSRQSFNVIFGECPYCSKPLTLKMSGRKA
ncbi:E3 ubiquitin-protein ligase FANCL isoform X2 [Balaenoptera ricei]|uniref:E3 ubiquitin-protein ligase FANCL isoform X2 n=1 Tax=Balaenoptera ricei TaxID=2746895 RepID=UPI0028BD1C8E|nr:E3 ubiquitin-protein ligase FANCL isoform X2 [Balaenoptera ricei]